MIKLESVNRIDPLFPLQHLSFISAYYKQKNRSIVTLVLKTYEINTSWNFFNVLICRFTMNDHLVPLYLMHHT